MPHLASLLTSGALAVLALSSTALAADRRPVVVELFTSQGCSSCPPANANLVKLSKRSDVLALSYSVTYWDRLGWKDIFGKEEYTRRQAVYEPKVGENGPFTPQMVINGKHSIVGNSFGEVQGAVGNASTGTTPDIKLTAGKVTIGAGKTPSGAADVWIVRYEPKIIEVAVERGENTGRTLPHANVVRTLTKVGKWSGEQTTFALPDKAGGLRTAVLVQEPQGGPILTALTN